MPNLHLGLQLLHLPSAPPSEPLPAILLSSRKIGIAMQVSNCDRCYRRKGRCDKLQPCSSCQKANVRCEYTDKVRQRRFTSDDVERIEKRLRQAEARNRTLADELSKATRSPSTREAVFSPAETIQSRSNGQQRRADAVSEVSYLSINAAGERQYLGSTSGLLFADLVRSSVDASVSRHATPPSASADEDAPALAAFHSRNDHRKFSDLPARSLVRTLMTAYVEHDAIAFPFIHTPALFESSGKFYQNDHYYTSEATAYEVFVFNMVLAIATANVYKYDWHMLPSAESHHERAMRELNPVLARGGLQGLQAILLLCQYRQGSSIKDNSASMWHLVGIASRICLELGLHRESAYPLKRPTELGENRMQYYVQQEIGRRCFWCLIAMDRVTSNILGRPLAVRDEDIDTAMADETTEAILTHHRQVTATDTNHTAIFNSIIQYRLLCGKILTTLHRHRDEKMTLNAAIQSRDHLAESLEAWFSGVQEIGLAHDLMSPTDERSCFLSEVWFGVLYANAKLMIWRPCPLLSDLSNDRISLQKIHESSVQAINVYAQLHKSRKINYSWITLQSCFLAGLSFIYSISRHLRARRASNASEACLLMREPSTLEIVNISRSCSNVLVAVAERWNALRHCHEVFDRLSDAVLADAIKLQTAPDVATTTASVPNPVTSISHVVNLPNPEHTMQQTWLQTMPQPEGGVDWEPASMASLQDASGASTQSNLAVDNEFLHCFDELQNLYNNQQIEDPVMHLSQDWLGYLAPLDGSYDQVLSYNGQQTYY